MTDATVDVEELALIEHRANLHGPNQLTTDVKRLVAQLRTLRAQVETLTQEREEARGSVIDQRHLANDWRQECLKAEAALAQMREALKAFLARWDEAEKPINSAITIATVHGFPYTGPTMKAELDALRALQPTAEPPKETP